MPTIRKLTLLQAHCDTEEEAKMLAERLVENKENGYGRYVSISPWRIGGKVVVLTNATKETLQRVRTSVRNYLGLTSLKKVGKK